MNYYAEARTNYFRVTDADAFRARCRVIGCHLEVRETDEGTLFAVFPPDGGQGFPSSIWDDEINEDIEIDIVDEIAKYLADDWVCVTMEAGHEGRRWVVGFACAFNNKGDRVIVDLQQIMDLAKPLGKHLTQPYR